MAYTLISITATILQLGGEPTLVSSCNYVNKQGERLSIYIKRNTYCIYELQIAS